MKMGYIFIIVGLALTLSGGILVCCQKKPEAQEEKPVAIIEEPPVVAPTPEEKSSKEKGNEYEGYIADILKQNGIVIKEWNQGAVSAEGAMADNALNPDFFVSQNADPINLEYWIEAKWRRQCDDSFALKSDQYERYRKKQRESKRKIIVAVGVGGSPSHPESVYFVPLDSMPDGKISMSDMRHFYLSNPGRDFAKRMDRWFHKEVFNKKRNK